MCNEIARRIALGQLRDDWSELKVPLVFPEALPNLTPLASIRITDPALILRTAERVRLTDRSRARRVVTRRFSSATPVNPGIPIGSPQPVAAPTRRRAGGLALSGPLRPDLTHRARRHVGVGPGQGDAALAATTAPG